MRPIVAAAVVVFAIVCMSVGGCLQNGIGNLKNILPVIIKVECECKCNCCPAKPDNKPKPNPWNPGSLPGSVGAAPKN